MEKRSTSHRLHFDDLFTVLTSKKSFRKIDKSRNSIVMLDIIGSTHLTNFYGSSALTSLPLLLISTLDRIYAKSRLELGPKLLFGFNGDGAFAVIPNNLLEDVVVALREIRDVFAEGNFEVVTAIRLGVISLNKLRHDIKYSDLRGEGNCIFIGGGLTDAEAILKNSERFNIYSPTEQLAMTNLHKTHIVSEEKSYALIVKPKLDSDSINSAVYSDLCRLFGEVTLDLPGSSNSVTDQVKIYDNLYAVLTEKQFDYGLLTSKLEGFENSGLIDYAFLPTESVLSVGSLNVSGTMHHFIDSDYYSYGGYGGGYTQAARLLKLKLALDNQESLPSFGTGNLLISEQR
jgi:hypothetical protein